MELKAAQGFQGRPALLPPPLLQEEGHHGKGPFFQEEEGLQKGPPGKPRGEEGPGQGLHPLPLGDPGPGPGRGQAEHGVRVPQVGEDQVQGLGKPGLGQGLEGLQAGRAGGPPPPKRPRPGKARLAKPKGEALGQIPLEGLPEAQEGLQGGPRPGRRGEGFLFKEGPGEAHKPLLVGPAVPLLPKGGVGVVKEDVRGKEDQGKPREEEGLQEGPVDQGDAQEGKEAGGKDPHQLPQGQGLEGHHPKDQEGVEALTAPPHTAPGGGGAL
ncbi:hypothetical protein TTMY_1196 [Thermus thermophilus]|nr:hypothetical protein TTMY_1196 [Thermus thermophilus]